MNEELPAVAGRLDRVEEAVFEMTRRREGQMTALQTARRAVPGLPARATTVTSSNSHTVERIARVILGRHTR